MKSSLSTPIPFAVIGLLLVTACNRAPSPQPQSDSSKATAPEATLTERTAKWDQTHWASEIAARPYTQFIDAFWDRLRQAPDPWAVFATLPLDRITWRNWTVPETIEHGITLTSLTPDASSHETAPVPGILAKARAENFQLELSEWRHIRFQPATNEPAQSGIAFTLHCLQPSPETRYTLRGELEINWQETTPPQIEAIRLVRAELLSRPGPTPFGHVVPDQIAPPGRHQAQEPNLAVIDLNHDGRTDIIASRINRIYWNQGQGQFRPTPLCDFPLAFLENGTFGDFNGDGHLDFLGFNKRELGLYQGDGSGQFPHPPKRIAVSETPFENPFVLTAADVDQDQDLDAWLIQYRVPYQGGQMPTPLDDANDGYPAYLLLNDGQGAFTDATETSGLATNRFRRSYSSSFIDLDADHDADLLVISDFAGIDWYENTGQGQFRNRTRDLGGQHYGFGMAHSFGDFDRNGQLDFIMIGMNAPTASRLDHLGLALPDHSTTPAIRSSMTYGNRLFLQNESGFDLAPQAQAVAETGWSWGTASGDMDNDGDEDLYIVNGHISGASVRDYESQFWLYDIYLGDSQPDAALDAYFQNKQNATRDSGGSFGGHEINRFFLNRGEEGFLEVSYLLGLALPIDCRNLVCEDLDGDGRLEWLTTSFETWPQGKQALHLFPNFIEDSGNWIGAHLRPAPGAPVTGAVVTLTTDYGQQRRWIVTGDSYRSQQAHTAHFGIGALESVHGLEVQWPGGRSTQLQAPKINQYHTVSAGPAESEN